MLIKYIFLISLVGLSLTNPIEMHLYKASYEELQKSDAMIDDIDKTRFLTELKLGSKSLPFQIETASEDICLQNENPASKTAPIYTKKELKHEQISLADKTFDFEYNVTDKILEGGLYKNSRGILGLSMGNFEEKSDKNFIDQLAQNKVINKRTFYFEFDEIKSQPTCKVPTLEEFLGIKGKLIFGDYPYNINSQKYSKDDVKTTPILKVLKNEQEILYDESSLSIQFDMQKCIGCTSCVKACSNIAGQDIIECEKKGKAHTATGKDLANTKCISCGQCSLACPTKAITEIFDKDDVENVLQNKDGKIAVVQFAPAIRINTAEALGLPAGQITTGKIVTALKMLGFDYIFDTNFAADMTIVEEATELIHRLNDPEAVLPMFTSCCPAWVNYLEISRPDLIPHLSSCKSPLSMLSSVIKNVFPKKIGVDRSRIYHVAVMPCTAKKDEIKRPQLSGDTDAVITSRELAQMIKEANIDFKNLEETPLDSIYSEYTGGGAIFCATGGVMEAAVRSAYKFLTGKNMVPMELKAVRGTDNGIKKASVDINGIQVNVAVAHGIKNAMLLLEKIKNKEPGFEKIHFIEVMACPGGCAMGGGSPKAKGKKGVQQRLNATYQLDESLSKRTPQDNDQLNKLYQESFDGEYGSHHAHELLHTYYTNRKVFQTWGINFKQVNFNHTSISSYQTQSFIKVEDNFIKAPHNFLPILKREFLDLPEYKEKCKLLNSHKYQFLLCNKDLDIDKFPKLTFYSAELDHTFVFEGKDLFVFDAKNNHYLFLVVFDLYNIIETEWELGLPFLRKTKLYFDVDNENLGLIHDLTLEIKSNAINSNLFVYIAIITFVLSLVIGYICMLPKKERKKRLNELEESDYNVA